MQVSKTNLIPFGKYKGQPVSQLQHDPEYASWLLQQPWFTERYSSIQTLIVNNFKEAADSPEHNALQAKFLDRRFAFSVTCAFASMSPFGKLIPFDDWCKQFLVPFLDKHSLCDHGGYYSIEFEVQGWDVVTAIKYWGMGELATRDSFGRPVIEEIKWFHELFCELKPTIGDDFPSVLRQVKSRKLVGACKCVLIEDFIASSVAFDDVREMYRLSGVLLLKCSEVTMLDIPEWVLNA